MLQNIHAILTGAAPIAATTKPEFTRQIPADWMRAMYMFAETSKRAGPRNQHLVGIAIDETRMMASDGRVLLMCAPTFADMRRTWKDVKVLDRACESNVRRSNGKVSLSLSGGRFHASGEIMASGQWEQSSKSLALRSADPAKHLADVADKRDRPHSLAFNPELLEPLAKVNRLIGNSMHRAWTMVYPAKYGDPIVMLTEAGQIVRLHSSPRMLWAALIMPMAVMNGVPTSEWLARMLAKESIGA